MDDEQIQDKIRKAREYTKNKTADVVYIWRRDLPDIVIQCEIVDDEDRWFMQG